MYSIQQLIHFARNNEEATKAQSDRVFIAGNTRSWGETADALEYLVELLAPPATDKQNQALGPR